jgi:gamma-glutamylcyclotransferase (GGCT)/AIG2-like uncharacterized protein YtfP
LSSAWVGAIAAVASALIAVVGLFVVNGDNGDDGGSAPEEEATQYFMYGTMMPGHLRYPAIDQFVASTTPDTVSGSLFDTGSGYPAAKFDGGGQVHGFLLTLAPERAAEATRVIAELEGNFYRPVNVETQSGATAIAYEFVESTDGMTPIPDGVWDGQER